MSHLLPGAPKPAKQQQQAKPQSAVSQKMVLLLMLVGLLLYVYILMYIKPLYFKDDKMDHISAMAMETEQMIRKIHSADKKMAATMERISEAMGEY